jgi:hypothetical protein
VWILVTFYTMKLKTKQGKFKFQFSNVTDRSRQNFSNETFHMNIEKENCKL